MIKLKEGKLRLRADDNHYEITYKDWGTIVFSSEDFIDLEKLLDKYTKLKKKERKL